MTSYKDVFGRYADRPQVVHVTIKEVEMEPKVVHVTIEEVEMEPKVVYVTIEEVEMEPKVVYVTVEKVDRLHNEWRAHSVYTEPKTSGGDA